MLHQLEVASVRLHEDTPAQLAALRAGTNLKLPDCCVLLAAQQTSGAIAELRTVTSAAS